MPDTAPTSPRTPVLAVIALGGDAMRYAEVEATADGPRLRRLGTCDFELDAEAAVFGSASADGDPDLSVVSDALRDVFAGTSARSLVVATAATGSTAFFTPLPAGMSAGARDEQFRQEAALLADVPPATPVRVRAVPVRTEGADSERRWYHVLHVGEGVHARLGRLAAALGVGSYDVADTARAAAVVARSLGADAGVDLLVGAYGAHTEAAVVRDGVLLFSHHGPGATPEDTAYFALATLEATGLDAASVGRLFAYGDGLGDGLGDGADAPPRLAMLAGLTGTAPRALDALPLFGRPVGASPWELAAFGPVLGAALDAAGAPSESPAGALSAGA